MHIIKKDSKYMLFDNETLCLYRLNKIQGEKLYAVGDELVGELCQKISANKSLEPPRSGDVFTSRHASRLVLVISQICSPMCFIVEGRQVSSHTRPTPGGTSATGSARWPVMGRAAPSRTPPGASPPAGACHAAPAPDTDRPCAAASCHAGGLPYTQPAPRRRPDPLGRPPYPTAVRKVRP